MSECGDCLHGVCDATGSCVCDELWTGHTDFVTQDLSRWGGRVASCPTSLVGVKLIWAFPLPMMICVWTYSVVALIDQWRLVRTQHILSSGRVRWYRSLPVDYLLMMVGLGFPCSFALAMIKILRPRELFAVTPLATVLLALTRTTTAIGFGLHFTNAARLAFKQHNVSSQELDQQVRAGIAALWTAISSAVLISLLPVVALGYPPMEASMHDMLFTFFMGLSSLVYFCLACWVLRVRQGLKGTFDRMIARFAELNNLAPTAMASIKSTRGKSSRAPSKRETPGSETVGSGRSAHACINGGGGKPASDKSGRFTESAAGQKVMDNAYIGRLLSVRDKALHQQAHAAANVTILSLMYLLFCVVPSLRAQATYLMALHLNAYNIVGFKVAHLYVRTSRQDVRNWLLPCCPAPAAPEAAELGAAGSGVSSEKGSESPRPVPRRPENEQQQGGLEMAATSDLHRELSPLPQPRSFCASPPSRARSNAGRVQPKMLDTDA